MNQYRTGSVLWKNITEKALVSSADVDAMYAATRAFTDKHLFRRERVYRSVMTLNLKSKKERTNMVKTNIGLVAHAEKALKEGWYYLWGAYRQNASQAVIDSNIRQYPDNERWRGYVTKAIGKTRVCDCYGQVKSYLWWPNDGSNPKYNSAHDRNTTMAYNAAKEKGLLSTLPEMPGIILWMSGHVGSGRFIECTGGGVGMSEGRIVNKVITKGSKFTHWFKDSYITYEEQKSMNYIDEFVKRGIIKSPEYWEKAVADVPYLKDLLANV